MVDRNLINQLGFTEEVLEKELDQLFTSDCSSLLEQALDKKVEALTPGTGLILIVDDEESLRLTLKEILETCGYNVLLAEDGRQGLKLFKQRSNEIKLILLDLAMPIMSGKESYVEMKKIFPSVKVLVISGFKHDQRVREIIELGVNGFLAKPFTMAELSRKIAEVIQS